MPDVTAGYERLSDLNEFETLNLHQTFENCELRQKCIHSTTLCVTLNYLYNLTKSTKYIKTFRN